MATVYVSLASRMQNGCTFCASTIGGKERDLTASEMLDQIYRIQTISGERVSNVVVMGTGEPLDNYNNLVRFIRILSDSTDSILVQEILPYHLRIPNKIRVLADEELPLPWHCHFMHLIMR